MKQAIPKCRDLNYKAYKRALQLPKSQRPKKKDNRNFLKPKMF